MNDKTFSSRLEGTKLIIQSSAGIEEFDSQFLIAALLVYVARGSGSIEPEESAKMIELIEEQFHLQGAESLELLTRAVAQMMDNAKLGPLLGDLAPTLAESDKEEIALMALKVVAADGHRHFAEMEQFERAMQALQISPETIHRAFDRYFAETMPGS